MRHLKRLFVPVLVALCVSGACGYSAKSKIPAGHCFGPPSTRRRDIFPSLRSIWTTSPIVTQSSFLNFRGGATATNTAAAAVDTRPTAVAMTPAAIKITMSSVYLLAALLATFWLVSNQSAILKIFDKTYLQSAILELLQSAKEQGTTGIFLYVLGMAMWEAVGISTIPVETAAGMAFGWSAIPASVVGKLMGASIAFGMGRGLLSHAIQEKFRDNETLLLVRHAVKEHPLRTAVLMKYSCFPETIKNYGSSLFEEVHYWMFALATIVHGSPFTCVWTWLGVDSANRLIVENLPADQGLQLALGVSMFVGIVVCPLLMAWWIRDMKRQSSL